MNIRKIKHEYKKGFSLEIDNLEISSNKIIGLVGENGAGKTTLMSILSGFMKANKIYDLIILDEPFNSIDVKYIYKLKQLLQNIKQRGAIILISSHILDTLVDLCDEFVVLDSGKIKDTFTNTKTIKDMEERIFEGSN